jgi:hypothetical protein
MSDNKELLTIAVIAAALMMVLGTSIPSSVLASTSIEAAEPSDESGNDDSSKSGDSSGNNEESSDGNSDNNSSDDSGNSGSNDDGGNDENSDDGSSDNDSSDSNNDGGVPEEYLGEYSTCVSDLSSDDSILTQDDVVDCYGQVFGPNPSHNLGPLTQNDPTSPATNMPGFENMPSALQQPEDPQQQMQPFGQSQPQDGQQLPIQQQQSVPETGDQQQMQPFGQSQPQDGQQLPIQQQQQQYPQTGMGGQQQMSPTELPIDAGILDVETIKEIVKNRLAQ